jgi:hypothetical protein
METYPASEICQQNANMNSFFIVSSVIELQYSLFYPICHFVTFPVLNHALTNMEQTGLFALLRPRGIFSFVEAEGNPTI